MDKEILNSEKFAEGIGTLKKMLNDEISYKDLTEVMIDTLFDCVSDFDDYSNDLCAKLKHAIGDSKDHVISAALLIFLTHFDEMEEREKKAFRAGFKLCAAILQTLPDVNYQRMFHSSIEELRKILNDAVNQ